MSPGQTLFPTSYRNSYVPSYYRSFYPDTADNYYRYANGNVYAIEPLLRGLIEDVIPSYGYGYGYGQMLPRSATATTMCRSSIAILYYDTRRL